MNALEYAIARQAATQIVPQPVSAEDELIAARAHSMAIDRSHRMGRAVLAWCNDHQHQVGIHTDLVERLRIELATRQPIAATLLALWCEVPGTAAVKAGV